MTLLARFWTVVTYVASFGLLSPPSTEDSGGKQQTPLIVPSGDLHHGNAGGPIFKPPGGRLSGPGSDFVCEYPAMVGWSACSTPQDRGCWLKNDKTGKKYDIHTNYELDEQTPVGIHRTYHLNVTDGWVNADGLNFTLGKFFNNTYPGPWLQACWGDVSVFRIL